MIVIDPESPHAAAMTHLAAADARMAARLLGAVKNR